MGVSHLIHRYIYGSFSSDLAMSTKLLYLGLAP